VPDLVRHFVRQAVGEGLDAKRFDGDALDVLKAYPWPGNMRELENVVRRVMALYPAGCYHREIIDNELRESADRTRPKG
jgi:two-component system nitrogen regulation response regulator GlnG